MDREMERRAIADAAYDAWRNGRNYDSAWDRAQEAMDDPREWPAYDYREAYDRALRAAEKEG